jgi:adenylosuccinate lyase
MRTEIGELAEAFGKDQTGSSTMGHKRNPINFENTEGMWIKNKNEFGKVMDTLISEHQRDLVNSSVMRDFPIILINLMYQLNTLLRVKKDDEQKVPFIGRVKFDSKRLRENFEKNAHLIMAEPIYISLQLSGYEEDAHYLVNHILTPQAQKTGLPMAELLEAKAKTDEKIAKALFAMPPEVKEMLWHPEEYTGKARDKALEVAMWAVKETN